MPVLDESLVEEEKKKKTNLEKFAEKVKGGIADVGEFITGVASDVKEAVQDIDVRKLFVKETSESRKRIAEIGKQFKKVVDVEKRKLEKAKKRPLTPAEVQLKEAKPTLVKNIKGGLQNVRDFLIKKKIVSPSQEEAKRIAEEQFKTSLKPTIPTTPQLKETFVADQPSPILEDVGSQALDLKKVEAERKRQERLALESVKKLAQESVRKESLKSAVEQTELFNKQLEDAFAKSEEELAKLKLQLSPNQKLEVTVEGKTKVMTVAQYEKELKFQKEKAQQEFEKQLEKGVKKFEKIESKRIIEETKKSTEFLRTVGSKTVGSIFFESGIPKPEFTDAEAEAVLTKLGLRPKLVADTGVGLRQELGVSAGKTLAQLISLGQATPEGERLGVQIVGGATFGVLAPKSAPLTPEEQILRGASSLASFEFAVAPLISKAVTEVGELVPKVKRSLAKSPFFEVQEAEKVVFKPVVEEQPFRVFAEDITGVRVGGEKVGSGTAFAFTDDVGGTGVAEKFKLFGFEQKAGGGSQFIKAGTETVNARVVFIGEEFLELPTPFEIEIFERTGKVPKTFRFGEQTVFRGMGDIPEEIIAEGGESVEKFLQERIIKPEKGVSFFTEKRVPPESSFLESRKAIFELIPGVKKGTGFDIKFAALEGSEELSEQIVEKASRKGSLIFPNTQERIIDLPVGSAGAGVAPITVFKTGRVQPALETVKGSLAKFVAIRTKGFVPELVVGTELVAKEDLLTLVLGVFNPFNFESGTTQRTRVSQRQDTLVAPKLAVLSRQAQLQDIDVLTEIRQKSIQAQRQRSDLLQFQTPAVAMRLQTIKVQKPKPVGVKLIRQQFVPSKTPSLRLKVSFLPKPSLPKRKKPKSVRKKKNRPIRKVKSRESKFFPLPDLATKTITEAKTFRPATALKKTPETKRKLKSLFRRGVTRFPTREILRGEITIKPKGSLAVALREFKPSKKKTKKKKKEIRFI